MQCFGTSYNRYLPLFAICPAVPEKNRRDACIFSHRIEEMLYPGSERPKPSIKVDSSHEHYQFVVDQLIGRCKRRSVVRKLVRKGMDYDDAVFFVRAVFSKLVRTRRYERLTPGTLLVTLAGGTAAALAASSVWTLTILATATASGAMAIGVGVASGFAVLGLSFKQRGILLQIIAVLSTGVGLAAGKYANHALVVMKHESSGLASMFSAEAFTSFTANIGSVFSLFDLIWLPLSFAAAIWLSRGWGVTLKAGDHVVGRADFLIGERSTTKVQVHEDSAADFPEGWAPRTRRSQEE